MPTDHFFFTTPLFGLKSNSDFDLTMGSCDWAGMCELVEIYLFI